MRQAANCSDEPPTGRTANTLFLLMSVDGKISTGMTDSRDVDQDYKRLSGIMEGLHQYYEREQQTDWHSLNSGRVMAKMGVNGGQSPIGHPEASFIIIDNTHLTKSGVAHLAGKLKKLYLVTKNPQHPAKGLDCENLTVLDYAQTIDFTGLFATLHTTYGWTRSRFSPEAPSMPPS